MIEGIAFDLDGTLIDSGDILTHAWDAAFTKFNVKIDKKEFRKYIGLDPKKIIRTYLPDISESSLLEVQRLRYEYVIQHLNDIVVYPEVPDVLSYILQRKIKMSIATSMGSDLLDQVVKHSKLDKFMDYWVSSNEVKRTKPAPDVFLKAMELMKIDARNCLVVGDRGYDIMAGSSIGSKTVLILRDSFSASEVKATYEFKDLRGLMSLF